MGRAVKCMPSILNPNQHKIVQDYAKWVNYFGLIAIITGIPTILAIVGLVQIWYGLELRKTAKTAKALAENADLQGLPALNGLTEIMERQAKLAKVLTIIFLVQIVVFVLGLLLGFGSLVALISGGN